MFRINVPIFVFLNHQGMIGREGMGSALLDVDPCKYAHRGEAVVVTTHAQLSCKPRLGSIGASVAASPPGSR
jgi:hypothetical protein